MNIKILDSWLREYLKTDATPEKIGECLSLTSVGVEKIERFGNNDFVYDIEVTTNRPDLMSVIGIAREAAAILPEFKIDAQLHEIKFIEPKIELQDNYPIEIKNNPELVKRICAVVMEVNLKESPQYIKDRLESSDIRSLNNLIDVTNYVMREVGHPAHVFDYDRLTTHRLEVRESRKNEIIKTLDGKEYHLPGGDIVADDGLGHIVDLLGVMGLENSVVTDKTERILFFIDTVEPYHIRQTSMSTTIRTDAAILNEKGIDPTLAKTALLRGIELYKKIADAKIVSQILDIYPDPVKTRAIHVQEEKIERVIGIPVSLKEAAVTLKKLGFEVSVKNGILTTIPPSWRADDVQIEEDIIEEIARIYGYHRLPSVLPPVQLSEPYSQEKNRFYWEMRAKNAFKYWGFTEVYTYSLISEDMLEAPPSDAVKLKNPLSEDMVYLRQTLIPSLLKVVTENKNRETIQIFEIANVYNKQKNDLPEEIQMLAGIIKKPKVSFYEVKGIIEQLLSDLGIENVGFEHTTKGGEGAEIFINTKNIGEIEILDENLINFELNFEEITRHATLKKMYTPIAKFPPIIEDMRFEIAEDVSFGKITNTIKKQNSLIVSVDLLDTYKTKKTYRIKYQDPERNLTNEDITPIREKITKAIEKIGGALA